VGKAEEKDEDEDEDEEEGVEGGAVEEEACAEYSSSLEGSRLSSWS